MIIEIKKGEELAIRFEGALWTVHTEGKRVLVRGGAGKAAVDQVDDGFATTDEEIPWDLDEDMGGNEIAPTVEAVLEAAKAFATEHGKAPLVEALKAMGAKKVTVIPEAKRAEFIQVLGTYGKEEPAAADDADADDWDF